jgi:hypothetical protein
MWILTFLIIKKESNVERGSQASAVEANSRMSTVRASHCARVHQCRTSTVGTQGVDPETEWGSGAVGCGLDGGKGHEQFVLQLLQIYSLQYIRNDGMHESINHIKNKSNSFN